MAEDGNLISQFETKLDRLVERYNNLLLTLDEKLQFNGFLFTEAMTIIYSLKDDVDAGLIRAKAFRASFMISLNLKLLTSLASRSNPSHQDRIATLRAQHESIYNTWKNENSIAAFNDNIPFSHSFS